MYDQLYTHHGWRPVPNSSRRPKRTLGDRHYAHQGTSKLPCAHVHAGADEHVETYLELALVGCYLLYLLIPVFLDLGVCYDVSRVYGTLLVEKRQELIFGLHYVAAAYKIIILLNAVFSFSAEHVNNSFVTLCFHGLLYINKGCSHTPPSHSENSEHRMQLTSFKKRTFDHSVASHTLGIPDSTLLVFTVNNPCRSFDKAWRRLHGLAAPSRQQLHA